MTLIKTEIQKLRRKSSSKVLFVFYCIGFIAVTLFYLLGENVLNLSLFTGNQYVGVSLSVMMSFMLPLLTLYLASSIISLDFSKGTIKNMYLLPVDRQHIFISKILTVQYLVGMLLAGQFVISTVIAFIQDGITFFGLGSRFLDYMGAFLVLLLINLLGATLTLLVKNTGLVILIAYGSYIALSFVTLYIPAIKSISIHHIITSYSDFFTRGGIPLLLSAAAYYIIVFIVGLLLFEKKDESICQFD